MKNLAILLSILAVALGVGLSNAVAAPQSGSADATQAIKLVRKAHKLIEGALPVYQGNRVMAGDTVRLALRELTQSMRAAPPLPIRNKGKVNVGRKRVLTPDSDPRSMYSRERLAKSDKMLNEAGRLLDRAIDKLNFDDPATEGARRDAVAKLRDAQKRLHIALSVN